YDTMGIFAVSEDQARIFERHRIAGDVHTMATLASRLDNTMVDDIDGLTIRPNARRLLAFGCDGAGVDDHAPPVLHTGGNAIRLLAGCADRALINDNGSAGIAAGDNDDASRLVPCCFDRPVIGHKGMISAARIDAGGVLARSQNMGFVPDIGAVPRNGGD